MNLSLELVRQYLDANPQVRNETAAWLRSQGEQRDVYQWVMDDIAQNPSSVHYQSLENFINGDPIDTPAPADSGGPIGPDIPLEQALLNQTLPGLLGDINRDADRQALIDQLTGQLTGDYQLIRDQLSPEANAARIQEEYNQADLTASRLSDSATASANSQLQALQNAISSMQGNLSGELAAKAAALQQQVGALNANLDALDTEQKAALAQQITSLQSDLEKSVADQRTALQAEIASLGNAADANAVARRAALQQEIDGLTAAQAPLSQARLASAAALSSAVNLGLQGTQDQLTAQRAKQGYLGSSSFDAANLARAGIAARQQAAGIMGSAREANATDIRAIDARKATEGRSIEDELANNLLAVATRGATGERTLADLLAGDTRTIADTGATGLAGIRNNTAGARFNIGSNSAAQQYADTVGGAATARSLADTLAGGTSDIWTNAALQQQQARDSGTLAKQGYFDNAYTRGLGQLLSLPGTASSLVGSLGAIDNYGGSGARRALGTLDWWSNNTQAPTAGYVPTQADTSGNDIAGLGAGLLSAGLSYGNANNWWQKPAATAQKTTTPAASNDWWLAD